MRSRSDQHISDCKKEKYLKRNYDSMIIWESSLIKEPRRIVNEIKEKIKNK